MSVYEREFEQIAKARSVDEIRAVARRLSARSFAKTGGIV